MVVMGALHGRWVVWKWQDGDGWVADVEPEGFRSRPSRSPSRNAS